jgi:hypothetical protein
VKQQQGKQTNSSGNKTQYKSNHQQQAKHNEPKKRKGKKKTQSA